MTVSTFLPVKAGEEIFQVLFEAKRDQDDGPYFLLQRAFLEEYDGEDASVYVETNDIKLIGHYSELDVELTRNQLTIKLPPPISETIEVTFQATNEEFMQISRMLKIIVNCT